MDPVSLVGAVVGLIQISSGLVKLSQRLNRCIRSARSAPKEVQYFVDETSVFTGLMNLFFESATNADRALDDDQKLKRVKLIKKITKQCSFIEEGIVDFADTFMQTYKNCRSKSQAQWARIRWVFSKPNTVELQHLMNNAKITVNLLSTLLLLDNAERNSGDTERTRNLKAQLRLMAKEIKKTRKAFEKYRERQPMETNALLAQKFEVFLDGTYEVEKFVFKKMKSEDKRAREEARSDREARSLVRQSPPPEPRRRASPDSDRPSTASPGIRAEDSMREPAGNTNDKQHSAADPGEESSMRSQKTRERASPVSISRSHTPPSTPSRRKIRHKVVDVRLVDREEGKGISEHYGEWPTDAHGSDVSLTDDTSSNATQRHGPCSGIQTRHQSGRNGSGAGSDAGRS